MPVWYAGGMDVINLGTETIHIDVLMQHPKNPNVGDLGAIRSSIRENGFYGTVIARKAGPVYEVLAGWHRTVAAAAEGLTEVPVTLVEADDVLAVRIMLADNETARRGRYDKDVLDELLGSLESLDGTGFDDDLDALADILDEEELAEEEQHEPGGKEFETQYGILLGFDGEKEQREAYDKLKDLGFERLRVVSI